MGYVLAIFNFFPERYPLDQKSTSTCVLTFASNGTNTRTYFVFEQTVFVEYVRTAQLDVLGNVGLGPSQPRVSVFEVVEETLGHERVLIQINQVGSLGTILSENY